ncbi:glycosyltransferase [Epibacterium sp. SM1969]|uniref:Glycosyltransferase n=1 Tax=Tritonibacter aquimaris TaxID=2663379 RepID=A0A844AWE1_9RHOB|nr:glycosyltransferase [Tritonibacter aquimaris]
MKIAYVLNTYPQPSHSFIRRELHALERQGCEVLRLAMRASPSPLVDAGDLKEQEHTEYVLAAGGKALGAALLRELKTPARFARALVKAIKMGRRSSVGVAKHLIYLAEAAWVKQRCQQADIDHMHAHFGTNATAVAMLARALGGPSYSFTVHGPEEFDGPQQLSLGEKVDQSAFTVAISRFGRSQLCRWAEFDSWSKINVVHCGIETARFAEVAELPNGPLRLAAIGRFVEQKGQMDLIHALAEVVQVRSDVHLTLIGDGEMRPALEAAIKQHGLEANVTLTGWLDEAGVRAELNNSHALVMPSFAEGLPMVVMEAMAAARPVIATYIAGTPELVLPGKTGWMVPAGSPSEFARAILKAADMPLSELKKMGDAGRARVLQRHDSEQEAAKLLQHFQSACAN